MSARESWTITCDVCGDTYTLAGTLREVQVQARDDFWYIRLNRPLNRLPDYCPECAHAKGLQ